MTLTDTHKLRAEIAHDLILAGRDPCIFGRPVEAGELKKVATRFGTLEHPRVKAEIERLSLKLQFARAADFA